ncbi:MAG: hypothetical protein IPL63_00185 [Saprospiraceae bacterium]|nr:hypothetical protein [Saprospiraceae bacterium]MBK8080411.1 hypothetical protein [Saprospiraceae bacterium]MBK8371289.1 hypothetical protein [Saprospiraceae bacterium]MBK8545853.1 hypothetical protein [Saprospiraceae bacterium]MBK8853845.1 hypothetical protein [Saprospiraceae bacterium]
MTYSANIDLNYSNSSIQQNSSPFDVNHGKISLIKSFGNLDDNWNSYGANKPTAKAIVKAVNFAKYLSDRCLEIFFTAPTPDGDILIELKNGGASLEFIFSSIDEEDKIIGSFDSDEYCEAKINDTTKQAYLKWLICPDGDCPNF